MSLMRAAVALFAGERRGDRRQALMWRRRWRCFCDLFRKRGFARETMQISTSVAALLRDSRVCMAK